MTVTAVHSTTLTRITFDEPKKVLGLEFRDGSAYQYFEVPTTVYKALLAAPSKGSYFNQAIRGRFVYASMLS